MTGVRWVVMSHHLTFTKIAIAVYAVVAATSLCVVLALFIRAGIADVRRHFNRHRERAAAVKADPDLPTKERLGLPLKASNIEDYGNGWAAFGLITGGGYRKFLKGPTGTIEIGWTPPKIVQ